MTFDEYQQKALSTLLKGPDRLTDVVHMALGVAGESAEVGERIKKIIRDHGGDLSKVDVNDLKKEIGDVLWHVAVMSQLFDLPLSEVATANIEKLAGRKARGTLKGSGDNR